MKSLLSWTVFCCLKFYRLVVGFIALTFFGILAGGLLVDCFGSPADDTVSFLPDDAEVACRAICFRRSDWADFCAREPSVALGHPEACRDAGFQQGQSPQGR